MPTARLRHEQLKGKRPDMTPRRASSFPVRPPRRTIIPPRPRKLRPILEPKRRMVTLCVGVPAVGRWPSEKCPGRKLVRWTPRAGRPSPRCGECRVVRAWRAMFTYEEPEAVAEAIRRLARAGRIGRAIRKA